MPMDKSLYDPQWKQISARIRERAHNKCEQCGVANGLLIARSIVDPEQYVVFDDETGGVKYPDGQKIRASEEPEEFAANEKFIKVVLTCAHLNHDPSDNRDENLRVLCQLHHNRLDAKVRARHAKKTRKRKKDQQTGQIRLWDDRIEHGG